MPIRMTGMMSGLDTDSIIKELMSVQSMKLRKKENLKTKTEWKQEKWKDLNSKIYSLYTGKLSKMKTQGNYATKKVNSSDDSIVSATAGSSAAMGSHTLEVKSLASAQYVTGAKITESNFKDTASSKKLTKTTKLTDLNGFEEGTVISIKNKSGTEKKLEVSENTTLEDFLKKCQDANLNASFDEAQGRLFISSKDSGDGKGFSIQTDSEGTGSVVASSALKNLKAGIYDLIQYDELDTAAQTLMDDYFDSIDYEAYANMRTAKKAYTDFQKQYDEMSDTEKLEAAEKLETLKAAYDDANGIYEAEKVNQQQLINDMLSDAETFAHATGSDLSSEEISQKLETLKTTYWNRVDNEDLSTSSDSVLASLGLGEITGEEVADDSGLTVHAASDAVFVLDGAELTSKENTTTINGLTLDMKSVTDGKTVTLSVVTNVDEIYNGVKDFIKEYNEVLKAMNDAYGADSARKYDVLTSEQKEAMSDEEVEKWEGKIKDSLLRRDTTLASLLSVMRSTLHTSVQLDSVTYEVIDPTKKDSDGNPKQYNSPVMYSLSSFGIITSSDYSEGSLLHIQGDEDDELYSGDDNKLKKALEENPTAVQSVLSKLCSDLYDKLTEKMAASSISSAMTFYNDKELKSQISNYDDELDTLQDKLNEQEDRYYSQFTAMEKAMSQMQSQSSSLNSLLGISG